jgi:hypothetical protein
LLIIEEVTISKMVAVKAVAQKPITSVIGHSIIIHLQIKVSLENTILNK